MSHHPDSCGTTGWETVDLFRKKKTPQVPRLSHLTSPPHLPPHLLTSSPPHLLTSSPPHLLLTSSSQIISTDRFSVRPISRHLISSDLVSSHFSCNFIWFHFTSGPFISFHIHQKNAHQYSQQTSNLQIPPHPRLNQNSVIHHDSI